MNNSPKMKKHWSVLAVTCLLYAGTLGLGANTLGVYYAPVSESLGILRGDFAMNSTIAALSTGIFSLFVPRILRKMGWKKTITMGAILSFVGLFGMGLTNQVLIFNLLGFSRGIGTALTTMVAGATLINQWFEKKNGIAISLATSFSGIGGIIFSPVFSWLIIAIGWEYTFFIHGILTFLLCLPAILMPYTFYPEDEGLLPYGAIEKEKQIFSGKKDEPVQLKDYLSIASISLILMAAFQTAVVGINQHFPSYGDSLGMSVEVSGIMLSAVMLGNMIFKILTGFLIDRFGAMKSMLLVISLNVLSLVALIYWTTATGLIINSFLYGSIFGTAVLYVVLPREFFGVKLGNRVYSIMVFSASMAIALSNAAIGYIYDFTGTYVSVLWMGILVQIVSLVFLLVSKKNTIHPKAD